MLNLPLDLMYKCTSENIHLLISSDRFSSPIKVPIAPTRKVFIYRIQVIHSILKYGIFQSISIKRILKINNSWTDISNFQTTFNCH